LAAKIIPILQAVVSKIHDIASFTLAIKEKKNSKILPGSKPGGLSKYFRANKSTSTLVPRITGSQHDAARCGHGHKMSIEICRPRSDCCKPAARHYCC